MPPLFAQGIEAEFAALACLHAPQIGAESPTRRYVSCAERAKPIYAAKRAGCAQRVSIFCYAIKIFEWTMTEKGLIAVEDPSMLFLVRRDIPAGTAAVLEGSRTLLVEIQALCVPAKGSISRVYSDRIDLARR
jgi:hypothetical protein